MMRHYGNALPLRREIHVGDTTIQTSFAHIPRFGVAASVGLICDAERWGLGGAWVPDQPFYLDPYPILTASALATNRIQLGIGVTNAVARHPVVTARLAATVADIAPGRVRLGLGTGNRKEYLQPLGLSGANGAEACKQAIGAIRSLLAGERINYQGGPFTALDVSLTFDPQPMPLYVAGIAPNILATAGAVADGLIVGYASTKGIGWALDHVTRNTADGSDRTDFAVVAWNIVIVTDDVPAAYDRIRPFIAHKIAPSSRATLVEMGFPPLVIDRIRETYWSEGSEKAAMYVTDDMVELWSWVGSPELIADRMAELGSLGVTEIAMLSIDSELDEVRRNVWAFASEVAPLLQQL